MGIISTIRADLVTALQAITNLQDVFDYPIDQFTGYPAIIVESNGVKNKFSDTANNRMTFAFSFYLYQGINDATPLEIARKRVDDLADVLYTAFNADLHIAGSLLTSPLNIAAPTIQDRPTPMIMVKMDTTMIFLVNRGVQSP